jgi:hypothetical protein
MPDGRPTKRLLLALLGAGTLVALGYGLGEARRAFIRAAVLRDGPVPVNMSLGPSTGDGLAPASALRVVLLDGLGAAPAAGLPALSAVCAAGRELRIDVGFPTVSLPVQSVLWTGRTQQQSGLQYRAKQLDAPPAGSLPTQVADSVAVAESHPEIVRSFGFATVRPDPTRDPTDDAAWRAAFPEIAVEAVASPARLVHVHVLRIDEAGHKSGGASPEYAAAAAEADALLARMRASSPDGATWLVLADHGHIAAGGHGSEDPAIRLVRGCLAGPNITPSSDPPPTVHLVDVARAVADTLHLQLPADAPGRPFTAALADPAADATLPRPGPLRAALAAALVALAVLAGVRSARSQGTGSALARRLPWAAALGLVGLAVYPGWPTLSDQPVFAPKGQQLWYGCLPAAVAAGVLGLLGRPWRSAAAQLLPAAGLLLAALILCRAPEAWLLPALGWGEPGPPLMPRWTAASSAAFILVRCVAEGAAAALLLSALLALRRRRDRA